MQRVFNMLQGAIVAFSILFPAFAIAQEAGTGNESGGSVPEIVDETVFAPAVLILDFEQLYTSSAYSQRIEAEIKAETLIIQAENERIVAELEAEEQELTTLRGQLSTDLFRKRAAEFDAKVEKLRAEPLEKERELLQRQAAARRVFLQAAQPILQSILLETGASVILDRRNVIMHASTLDITQLAIARTDAALVGELQEETLDLDEGSPNTDGVTDE